MGCRISTTKVILFTIRIAPGLTTSSFSNAETRADAETSVTSASSKRRSLAMMEKGKDEGDYKGRERGWRREIFLRRLRRFKERESPLMARRMVASEGEECEKMKARSLWRREHLESGGEMGLAGLAGCFLYERGIWNICNAGARDMDVRRGEGEREGRRERRRREGRRAGRGDREIEVKLGLELARTLDGLQSLNRLFFSCYSVHCSVIVQKTSQLLLNKQTKVNLFTIRIAPGLTTSSSSNAETRADAETSVTSASSKRRSLTMVKKGKDAGDYKGRERGWRREIFLRRLKVSCKWTRSQRFKEREGPSMARQTVASKGDECGKMKARSLWRREHLESGGEMGLAGLAGCFLYEHGIRNICNVGARDMDVGRGEREREGRGERRWREGRRAGRGEGEREEGGKEMGRESDRLLARFGHGEMGERRFVAPDEREAMEKILTFEFHAAAIVGGINERWRWG
ncbi:hypothetical protein ACLOJK_020720 [Asimina triloba]